MHLWGVKLQGAINASCHARKNDSGIAFEALCATIYKRNNGAGIQDTIFINQQG